VAILGKVVAEIAINIGARTVKYFIKAMQVMSIVSAWSVQAMTDGKVTGKEAYDLISQLAPVLGIKLEWDVPAE